MYIIDNDDKLNQNFVSGSMQHNIIQNYMYKRNIYHVGSNIRSVMSYLLYIKLQTTLNISKHYCISSPNICNKSDQYQMS